MQSKNFFFKIYLLAILCIGLAYSSLIPPFEGFDESAHLSLIWEVESGGMPYYGISSLDKSIYNYTGPTQYSSGRPPFDTKTTYRKFFSNQELVDDYRQKYLRNDFKVPFDPIGAQISMNWEAQHPPLYYLLMAPISKELNKINILEYFFALRGVSLIISLLGVMTLIKTIMVFETNDSVSIFKDGLIFYPLMLPMIFPDIARVGNDSLCLFFSCLLASSVIFYLKTSRRWLGSVLLGLIMGLGLLVKAFFLPINAAILLYLAYSQWADRRCSFKYLFMAFSVMLLSGGWWYLRNYLLFDSFTGSDELIMLQNKGGFISNFLEKFTLYELSRGLIVPFVSYIWAGTGSLVRMPTFLYSLQIFMVLIIVIFYIRSIKKIDDSQNIFIWIFSIFYFGLVWHMFNAVALWGRGTTPGWYLNILFPWAVPAIGVAVQSLHRSTKFGCSILKLFFYLMLLFQLYAVYNLFSVYSGCAVKGNNKQAFFDQGYLCLDNFFQYLSNMKMLALGFPFLQLLLYSVGFSLLWILFNKRFSR